MKICIDPGHYAGYNSPPCYPSYSEGTKMFTLATYLRDELLKYNGVEVILTKQTASSDLTLSTRGKMASGCDMFISLHTNAAGNGKTPSSAKYVVAYRSLKLPQSEELGRKLCERITDIMKSANPDTYNNGVLTRAYSSTSNSDYYGVIRSACQYVKYAYLIEHGFHTNISQVSWLNDDNNLRLLAQGEAEIIANYFKLSRKTTSGNVDKPNPTNDITGYIKILQDNTFVRNSLSWADGAICGSVDKNEVFTVVSDKIPVENGAMYKLKSGVYITASEKYVEFNEANRQTGATILTTPNKEAISNTSKGDSIKGYVRVLHNGTTVRSELSWDDSAKAGTVDRSVFTVVSDKIPVENGAMYKLKSGVYITASEKYVKFGKTIDDTNVDNDTPDSNILSPYEGTFRVSQEYKGTSHQGLDLVGVTSKKLFSRFNGVVEVASNADPNGFGLYVRLLITDGPYKNCRVYFGHMSSVCVKVGDVVSVGQQVGVEGSTGRSTGSHCHYEVRSSLQHNSFKDICKISGIPNKVGSYNSADL